ncbi:cytoplasmic tyrosine-protein kinase BMX-like [Cyanocitta cristata]
MAFQQLLQDEALRAPADWSHNRRKISPINYKKRFFVLTKSNTSDYEYDKVKKEQLSITCVQTPENKYYLTENHYFESIPKLIHYHQHNLAFWKYVRMFLVLFLESCQFRQGDLAARNCLIDSKLTVKVSDLGMTRYGLDNLYISSLGTRFPVKWSAQEVFHHTKFSSKSDAWSFHILMWEVFTLRKQPCELHGNLQKVSQGYRLYRPQQVSTIIYQIPANCWYELCVYICTYKLEKTK